MCSSNQTSHHPGRSNCASFLHYSCVLSLTFWLYIFICTFLASAHFFYWRHSYETYMPHYWKYKLRFRFIMICLRRDNDTAMACLPVHYFFKLGGWSVSSRVNKRTASSTKLNYLQSHLPKSQLESQVSNSHIYQHWQFNWQHLNCQGHNEKVQCECWSSALQQQSSSAPAGGPTNEHSGTEEFDYELPK